MGNLHSLITAIEYPSIKYLYRPLANAPQRAIRRTLVNASPDGGVKGHRRIPSADKWKPVAATAAARRGGRVHYIGRPRPPEPAYRAQQYTCRLRALSPQVLEGLIQTMSQRLGAYLERDATTQIILVPLDFIARLAGRVRKPRVDRAFQLNSRFECCRRNRNSASLLFTT